MEDLWDIKRVLESQGNMHNKVDVQSNSEFKLTYKTCPTSDLGDLHIHEKIKR
jgi:hypothetical protein